MANILKTTLNENGNLVNSAKKSITVVLDGSITNSEINSYLPNNGDSYDKEIRFLPNDSKATIITIDAYIICVFNAEVGLVDSKTSFKNGLWSVIGRTEYLT